MRIILIVALLAILVISPLLFPAAIADCVDYVKVTNTIRISCDANFMHVASHITDRLITEGPRNGDYILKANLQVDNGSRLTISSDDGIGWIKIVRDNGITIYGHIDIIGVRITSWNEATNAVIDNGGIGERAWFRGRMVEGANIINSEMAYLGYNSSNADSWKRGISFDGAGSTGVVIKNSTFHHLYYAFYSNNLTNSIIEGSEYYDNHRYAIDPHTGTSNLTIVGNHVHHNGEVGIICSLDCSNIIIENNRVHDHTTTGIMLSRGVYNSTVLNNYIWNVHIGISVSESPGNKIYNNAIYNVTRGIYFVNPPNPDDGITANNRAYQNIIDNAGYGIMSVRAPVNIVANNTIGKFISSYEYLLSYDSELVIENQKFSNDQIRGLYGNNTIIIQNSGSISMNGERSINTNIDPYRNALADQTITVSS